MSSLERLNTVKSENQIAQRRTTSKTRISKLKESKSSQVITVREEKENISAKESNILINIADYEYPRNRHADQVCKTYYRMVNTN